MTRKKSSQREPEEWTTTAFLDHFVRIHEQMEERKFAFILGAGASISSKIPSGTQLVDRWLQELHTCDPERDGSPINEWAKSDTLDIEGFEYDRRAEFYPQIYARRFCDDREEGYAYLENVMKDAHPGLGYSMLAQILAQTRHKVVITTNFDSLVADAALLFTDTFAQTCGHESLTDFVRVQPRRPLVAKIHRDLLMGPQNDPYETDFLHENWAGTLRRILTVYTPLVIGYGGNDGSLMNFLYSLQPNTVKGTIFWFYRGDKPNARIRHLVARQSGKLVPIIDFDVFMTQLAQPLGFGLLDAEIEKRAEKWASGLRNEWDRIKKLSDADTRRSDRSVSTEADTAAKEALDKVETRRTREAGHWWAWELIARAEPDPEKREAIYREATDKLPNDSQLATSFGAYMWLHRRDYDESERLYRRAMELAPEDASTAALLGNFMYQVRKDHDEAELLFRRALEIDSHDPLALGCFARFMYWARNDLDEAERLFRQALEYGPNMPFVVAGFATFMFVGRRNYEYAEKLYLRAIQLDGQNVDTTTNYAELLLVSHRYDEARRVAGVAWTLDLGPHPQAKAMVTFYLGLLSLHSGESDLPALGRLKTLLKTGFPRYSGSIDEVVNAMDDWISSENRALYRALADALSDEQRFAPLDALPRWKEVEPIPLDQPWENLGD